MKINAHPCEACAACEWRCLGRRIYDARESRRVDVGARKRFRVLFERWFPGALQVELEFLCCNRCGLVIYSPRPEPADIDAKYRFLNDLGAGENPELFSAPNEVRRSRLLFRYLARHLPLDRMRDVLDYGGADGRLMQAFLQAGRSCSLVDYTPQTIPGVDKLADTLETLPAARDFDLVVCSHVIEHVAEPLQTIQALSCRLRKDGVLYVEVPMEIWRKPPWQREPVTHINFFTPNSLWNLLRLAGLEPRSVHLSCHLHPGGLWTHCIRALASRADEQATLDLIPLKPVDLDRYLHPGPGDVFRYFAANPKALWRNCTKRLR